MYADWRTARNGLTSLVTMDGNRYTLELLAELRAEGDLSALVRVPFHFRNFRNLDALEQASAMTRDFADDWLASGFVKLFMDGVLDSGTAVTVYDYPDRPGWRGEPLFDADRLSAIATEAAGVACRSPFMRSEMAPCGGFSMVTKRRGWPTGAATRATASSISN